MTKICGL